MDFQFKTTKVEGAPCDTTNEENEYHLELKFNRLKITKEGVKKVQVLFLYGDLLSKMDLDIPDSENGEIDCEPKVYVIHSTPNTLSANFINTPIIFMLLNYEDKKIIGAPIVLESNECFANTVKCDDFKQQSLKKTCQLEEAGVLVGEISLIFTVIREIGNSNRYRKFYTESTSERLKMEK